MDKVCIWEDIVPGGEETGKLEAYCNGPLLYCEPLKLEKQQPN